MPLQELARMGLKALKGSEGMTGTGKKRQYLMEFMALTLLETIPRSQFHSISTSYRACWTENETIVKRLNQVMAAP